MTLREETTSKGRYNRQMEFSIADGGMSVTIDVLHRTQAPTDAWSKTFVEANVRASTPAFTATVRGPIGIVDLIDFRAALGTVYETLRGTAGLDTLDPLLSLGLSVDHLGHLLWDVAIVDPARAYPAQLSFRFESDQTYLPNVLTQLDAILAAYPVMPQQN